MTLLGPQRISERTYIGMLDMSILMPYVIHVKVTLLESDITSFLRIT